MFSNASNQPNLATTWFKHFHYNKFRNNFFEYKHDINYVNTANEAKVM